MAGRATQLIMEVAPSIPANDTTDNVLSGQRYERMPFDGFVTLYSTGSAAGLEEELNVGGESITGGRLPVNIQNRSPVVPDDLRIGMVQVEKGDLIQLTVTNTTAGALTYRSRLVLERGAYVG